MQAMKAPIPDPVAAHTCAQEPIHDGLYHRFQDLQVLLAEWGHRCRVVDHGEVRAVYAEVCALRQRFEALALAQLPPFTPEELRTVAMNPPQVARVEALCDYGARTGVSLWWADRLLAARVQKEATQ